METSLNRVEIDLSAVASNVRSVKTLIGEDCRMMAVVKADGYGHGMSRVAETALDNGASMLGVARVEEGGRLRADGLDAPILVMGYAPAALIPEIIGNRLTPTVWSADDARRLSEKAVAAGAVVTVHFKVDTGMGRLGKNITPEHLRAGLKGVVDEILAVNSLPGIFLEGIYTHFAFADDPDKMYTRNQMDLFIRLTDQLNAAGLSGLIRHAANSAAIIDMPETYLDMVRAGIAIYGLYPSSGVNRRRVRLQPAMTWKTRIIQLKQVPAGTKVSYGMSYTTPRPTTLAVVPIGYADGYNRLLSSRGYMLVAGKRAPVVGRVCMDLTILDVGDIEGVSVEDEVVVLGRQGEALITADEIAEALNTINYEVVSTIAHRVPRIYI
jgi:alanine racemase